MKRHHCLMLALGCLILTTAPVSAQVHNIGIQIGFAQPGYHLNSPDTEKSATKLQTTKLNGLKAGIVYDGTIAKGFGMSIGLNYTFAMHNDRWNDYLYYDNEAQQTVNLYGATFQYRTRYQYHQGEIFVDWQYKFTIAKQTYLILYTGPTIQCAFRVTSKDYYRLKATGEETTLRYPVESYEAEMDGYLRKLNVTWGIGAGFQYKRYFLRGGYDFGVFVPYKEQNFDKLGFENDRRTRGRLDQWQIRIGCYIWQSDN